MNSDFFDAKKVKEDIVNWIREWFDANGPGCNAVVAVSGGKDSFLLAKCMQHLQRVSDVPFEVEYLCMDPGYLPENRALIERNAAALVIRGDIVVKEAVPLFRAIAVE